MITLNKDRGLVHELGLVVGALLVAWFLSHASCSCAGEAAPTPIPVPYVPTATQLLPVPTIPEPTWVTVMSLVAVSGHWGADEGAWAVLISRNEEEEAGRSWDIPYPWQLTLRTGDGQTVWDCGLYERLEATWRVGYCLGGSEPVSGRYAQRVYLRVKDGQPQQLHVRIGLEAETVISR